MQLYVNMGEGSFYEFYEYFIKQEGKYHNIQNFEFSLIRVKRILYVTSICIFL